MNQLAIGYKTRRKSHAAPTQVRDKEPMLNSHVQGRIGATPERVPQAFWCPDLISTRDLGPSGVDAVLRLAGIMKSRPADFRHIFGVSTDNCG